MCVLSKILFRVGTFIAVTAGMVAAAQVFGEREIIFPEIAAILTGLVLAPQLPWRTTMTRLVVTLGLCAGVGLGVSTCVVAPLAVKITLAYILAQAVLVFSGTTLAPMISAAVLPVLLQSKGFVYPLAATTLAEICALVRLVVEKRGLSPRAIPSRHQHVQRLHTLDRGAVLKYDPTIILLRR